MQDGRIDEGLNPIGFLGCPLILEMEFFGDRLGSKLSKVSIGYLEETATRMGRKDVIHIAIGILANASSTRELFQFAGQIFKQPLWNNAVSGRSTLKISSMTATPTDLTSQTNLHYAHLLGSYNLPHPYGPTPL